MLFATTKKHIKTSFFVARGGVFLFIIIMKKLQLLLRIIVSPIVFCLSFIMIAIFPSIFLLLFCPPQALLKMLGVNIQETYKELFFGTFIFIIYPVANTREFIINAKFVD